jgi:non-specific serine/threonine protein kinase
VFKASWTLEAAEVVCGGAGLSSDEALECLGILADASLVSRLDEAGDEPRFGMLEIIREYALEQLAASGEADAITGRHLAWCLELAEPVRPLERSAKVIDCLVLEQHKLLSALR